MKKTVPLMEDAKYLKLLNEMIDLRKKYDAAHKRCYDYVKKKMWTKEQLEIEKQWKKKSTKRKAKK